jgi:DNA-binding XRE family transcriptional regulator
MKKIELGLDFSEIRKRIEIDMSQYRAGMWAKMIGVKTNSISNIHGKKGKANPSLEYVTAVARVTGKPIEWYLYGTQPGEAPPERHCKFCGDMSDEIKKICKQVKEIIEANHPIITPALRLKIDTLLAGLEYSRRVKKDHEDKVEKLERKVNRLEKLLDSGHLTGTGRAAGTGMQKRKM